MKGDVTIAVETSFEDATANDLGTDTMQDSYLIGQNATVTINAAEVDFNVLQAAMPSGADIDADESAVGFGTSSCVTAQALAKELVITPKCSANAPIVSITCYKAMVKEGFDWSLAETHEAIEIPLVLYPDLTQTIPGTFDKEGELFFRVDIS